MATEDVDVGAMPGAANHDHPRAWLQCQQIIHMLHSALECFAAQGLTQRRQAQLLDLYFLTEKTYAELSVELACTQGALRVRVCKAIMALHKHILECHTELL